MGRDAGGRFPHSPHSPRNQAARGAAGSGPVGNCTHRSPSLLFPFKDEKNQVLTTNIWLQMVSGGQGGPRPRMALPRLLRRSWVWTAGTAEAPGRGGGMGGPGLSSRTRNSRRFDSQAGHLLRLWVPIPGLGVYGRSRWMFLSPINASLSPSASAPLLFLLPISLPPPRLPVPLPLLLPLSLLSSFLSL